MMINPIVRREAKTSLRSFKMFIAIAVYTFLIYISGLAYVKGVISNGYTGLNISSLSFVYVLLIILQFGMTAVLIPVLTAGAISGERERQTLDILLVTKMSTVSIILGKLASSISLFILMMVATLPVFGIVFFFGGVSLIHLLTLEIYITVFAVMVGSIGIFFSTILKKTIPAMVVTYIVIGILCILPIVVVAIYELYTQRLYLSSVSGASVYIINSINPAFSILNLIDNQMGSQRIMGMLFGYTDNVDMALLFLQKYTYIINIFINLGITALFTFLSSKILRKSRD